jgi:hypothetical protein
VIQAPSDSSFFAPAAGPKDTSVFDYEHSLAQPLVLRKPHPSERLERR